jgi:hypothetical protein
VITHPIIGSDAFTLSTPATPMPNHDTTRESLLCSQLNLKVTLLHSTLGRYFPYTHLAQASSRFIRCLPNIKLRGLLAHVRFSRFSDPIFRAQDPSVTVFLHNPSFLPRLLSSPIPPPYLPKLMCFSSIHSLGRFSTCPSISSIKRKLMGQSSEPRVIFHFVL